ncbi:MAG: hypothetical protein IBX55_20690 [Methyloprofundus sp.]|nr:hypothetical protein [Methyloprofundus sp.]
MDTIYPVQTQSFFTMPASTNDIHSNAHNFSPTSNPIAAYDSVTYKQEAAMVFQGLAEMDKGEVVTHGALWNDLLEK